MNARILLLMGWLVLAASTATAAPHPTDSGRGDCAHRRHVMGGTPACSDSGFIVGGGLGEKPSAIAPIEFAMERLSWRTGGSCGDTVGSYDVPATVLSAGRNRALLLHLELPGLRQRRAVAVRPVVLTLTDRV